MSDPTPHEPPVTPFAPPGAARPVPPVPVAPPGDSAAAAWSPYAPPAVSAPPAGYAAPSPYPPAPYPPAPGYGATGTLATGPGYGTPPAYGTPPVDGPPPMDGQPVYGQPAYGQPAYGQPVYGQPVYGPPPGYGFPVPTDSLATASLVTSIAGLVLLAGFPGPVGLGLGIGALRRIRRNGTRGRGMAIAGIVVGAVGTLVAAGWVALAVWGASQPEVTSGLADEEALPAYTLRTDLVVGDCLRDYPASWDLGTAPTVDCAQDHALQVVALLPLTGPVDGFEATPDAEYEGGFADCTEQIERTAPGLLDEWSVWTDVSYPHPDDWDTGGTTAVCAIAADDPILRGSVLDGSATRTG